jgi:uncharacterized protein (DUF302 family)
MKLTKIIMIVWLSAVGLLANEDFIIYKVDNKAGKITTKSIEEVLIKEGYMVLVNRDMNGPFKKQFEKSSFQTYNLLTAYHKKLNVSLVASEELGGIFTPFSVAIYQKKGEKFLYVSFLSAKVQTKIVGKGEKFFKAIEEANKKAFLKAMPGAVVEKLSYEPIPTDKKLITSLEVEVDEDEADDNKDELEMVLDSGLKSIGFIKAGFNAYDVDLEEAKNEDFEFYDMYSLCKLKVIYNIALTHPEAGAFAPCTLAIYHKKGSGKTVMAFPNVYNWISSLALQDKGQIALLEKAQKDIVALLTSAVE